MIRLALLTSVLTLALCIPGDAQQPKPVFRELKVGDSITYTYPTWWDTYGFGAWLNAQRAMRGIGPVHCDAGLCQDAAANSSRGYGHTVMGRARRQNAGWGAGAQVWPMWISSPLHESALFDRSITRYGIACINGVWTFNAY